MLASVFSWVAVAQQTTPPPSADAPPTNGQASEQGQTPSTQQPPQEGKGNPAASSGGKTSGTSNDRLFYTLPNFLTLEKGAKVPPLTTKEKFGVVARSSFDPAEFPWWGLIAAIGQADNSEPAFGQGWGAYGKRYATTAGDSLVENFLVGAVFPSVIHQDPRFFQSGEGGFVRRTFYSVSRLLVTRSDSGHSQFNYSEIFGSATAAAVSTFSYHPRSTYVSTTTNPHMFVPSDRTLGNAAQVWATQLTLDAITISLKEFWPDIHRKISHKSKQQESSSTAP